MIQYLHSPARVSSKVDFPEPDGPMMAIIDPGSAYPALGINCKYELVNSSVDSKLAYTTYNQEAVYVRPLLYPLEERLSSYNMSLYSSDHASEQRFYQACLLGEEAHL